MQWTHKLPEQAGWYWTKFIPRGKKCETATVIVQVKRNGAKKLRVHGNTLESLCEYGERVWAGPLVPPNGNERED